MGHFPLITIKTLSLDNHTYGQFIQNVVDFFIMALCIFIFVKSVNSLKKAMEKKKEEEKAEEEVKVSDEVKLLTEIRDQLKAR